VGYDRPLRIYRRQRSILGPEIPPFAHCCQSAQFPLTRRWIKRDRFLPVNVWNPLRVNRCGRRIQ
jgi:hypothetical protein